MRNTHKIIKIYTIITGIIALYILFTYIDLSSQSTIITNSKTFSIDQVSLTKQQQLYEKQLLNLGFSKSTISGMTDEEVQQYARINGKIVSQIDLYIKINGNNEQHITKTQYQSYLKKYDNFNFSSTKLERISLKLIEEENNKFLYITEHHFDYSPTNISPMKIELQYGPRYTILNTIGKQLYWTASNFDSSNVKISKASNTSQNAPLTNSTEDEFGFFESDSLSTYYFPKWNKPNLLQDIVGYHFYSISEFEVPEGQLVVDLYIQGTNPHLSEQLQYEIKNQLE